MLDYGRRETNAALIAAAIGAFLLWPLLPSATVVLLCLCGILYLLINNLGTLKWAWLACEVCCVSLINARMDRCVEGGVNVAGRLFSIFHESLFFLRLITYDY